LIELSEKQIRVCKQQPPLDLRNHFKKALPHQAMFASRNRPCIFLLAALCWHLQSAGADPATGRPDSATWQPKAWVTPAVQARGVSHRIFRSAVTKRDVSYHLYQPAAYESEPKRRFPVVYWLHGSGGGLQGIPKVAMRFDEAIRAGKAPPCIVVFVNGLEMGMYVDWADGSAPVESMIIQDLLPHIDANYRTRATREGRLLDGFSMGGYGSARFGFKFPEIFRAVSIVGAGPLQNELTRTPRASRIQAEDLLRRAYGGEQSVFREASPRRLAELNARTIAKSSLIRMVIGERDETFQNNVEFHKHLQSLGIPHQWTTLPAVGHDPEGVLSALGESNWSFYRAAFGEP
jgi:enterochelin esterase-like enzyme